MADVPRVMMFHAGLAKQFIADAGGRFEVVVPQKDSDGMTRVDRTRPGVRALVLLGSDKIEAAVLDHLPDLEHIQVSGAGMDGIPLEEVARRGITIENAGAIHAGEVADFAMGLMLAARRELLTADRWVRKGVWQERPMRPSRSLSGAKIGIAGLGHIGMAIARRAEPFEAEVQWWGPRPKPGVSWRRHESLLELAKWADIMFVAVYAHAETRGVISRDVIEAVGRDGLIVNVSRGFVIDEAAMIAALKDGRLGQAALDVFETEPTPVERWRDVPNVVLAPHIAGATINSHETLKRHTIVRLCAALGV